MICYVSLQAHLDLSVSEIADSDADTLPLIHRSSVVSGCAVVQWLLIFFATSTDYTFKVKENVNLSTKRPMVL